MRLLHVTQPVSDGVAVVVADLTRGLVEDGWEVTIACPSSGDLPGWVEGMGARHEPWMATRNPGLSTPRECGDLNEITRRMNPDVVHLHSSKAGLAGRLVMRGRIPTVFSPHAWSFFHVGGPTGIAATAWERAAAAWTDVILCGSVDERESGRSAGVHGHYKVISNTSHIENPGFTQAQARADLGLDPQVPLAVCFGRFARQKGQDWLLSAWPAVRDAVPAARLALVGGGPEESRLRALSGPDVIFAAGGDRVNVARWIIASDIMVFPSRWETLSLAVLESLELGRPVVVSDCQGMREALDGGVGLMVPFGETVRLVAALEEYLLNRQRAASDGVRAATRFSETHGRRRARHKALYGDMLAEVVAGRGTA